MDELFIRFITVCNLKYAFLFSEPLTCPDIQLHAKKHKRDFFTNLTTHNQFRPSSFGKLKIFDIRFDSRWFPQCSSPVQFKYFNMEIRRAQLGTRTFSQIFRLNLTFLIFSDTTGLNCALKIVTAVRLCKCLGTYNMRWRT